MKEVPTISDYLSDFHFVFVIVVLLFGIGLYFTIRKGRSIDWPPETTWRKFTTMLGWVFTTLAGITWLTLLYLMVGGLHTSVATYFPKPPALIVLVLGIVLYFMLLAIGNTAFEASTGSARGDIMKKIGRDEED